MSDDHDSAPQIGGNRLVALAADIRVAHASVLDAAKTRAARALEAGHALLEAKSLVKHGEWLPWLKEHCGLPERTAQLYMKLAKQGLDETVVAALGLGEAVRISEAVVSAVGMEAAAAAGSWGGMPKVVQTPDYDPLAGYDEETQRQWLLFALFGVPYGITADHIEWIMARRFTSPDDWLGEEGAKWRESPVRSCMSEPSKTFKRRWAAFQEQHKDTSRSEIEAALERRQAA